MRSTFLNLVVLALVSVFAPSAYAAPGGGGSTWLPTVGPPGHGPFWGRAHAAAVFDDGQGPALYIGGVFGSDPLPEDLGVRGVARFDGRTWSDVGGEVFGRVLTLAVFDDGSGSALYAGGDLTDSTGADIPGLMRWNGTTWSSLGSGGLSEVRALAVFDDGSGAALYVGGSFTTVPGVLANRIAKWDGATWSPLASGMNFAVSALEVFDDGGGSALYAGGSFTTAGGVPANRIARWDGLSWSPVGIGVNSAVLALESFDDGTGAALYAGGLFTMAGGQAANRVARWDGASWFAVGAGLSGDVSALAAFDDGGGSKLIANGRLGGVSGAQWDGASWTPIPAAPGSVDEPQIEGLAVFDNGTGEELYAVGAVRVDCCEDNLRAFVARRRNGVWTTPNDGFDGPVRDIVPFNDGSGSALCAIGNFRFAGGERADHVARWDGTTWSPLGNGLPGAWPWPIEGAGEVFGGDLHVAAVAVSRWDGNAWTTIGTPDGTTRVLRTFDDGTGDALYVGGAFVSIDGVQASNVAKWDGAVWSALGSGTDGVVGGFAVLDDGTGPSLYAGGPFQTAGGVPARGIARWDGSSWSPLGLGVLDGSMLEVYDAGSGPTLYAGTRRIGGGGFPVGRELVCWDGSLWSERTALSTDFHVTALGVFDGGAGDELFVGIREPFIVGYSFYYVRRYNGASSSVLSGFDEEVSALVPYENAAHGGPALFVAGEFSYQPATGDAYLSRWGREVELPRTFCSGDGSSAACPCGNPGARGHGCDIPAGTGGIRMTADEWHPDFAGGGSVQFVGIGYPAMTAPAAQLIRGTSASSPPVVFGDGLRCVASSGLVRLGVVLASNGVSLNGAMHGAGAGTFYYQLWVRSQPAAFCDPAAAFNLSNGVELTWP